MYSFWFRVILLSFYIAFLIQAFVLFVLLFRLIKLLISPSFSGSVFYSLILR